VDAADDCGTVCKSPENDCLLPGGVGDYLRYCCNMCELYCGCLSYARRIIAGWLYYGIQEHALGANRLIAHFCYTLSMSCCRDNADNIVYVDSV